jgi:hypothetical protein
MVSNLASDQCFYSSVVVRVFLSTTENRHSVFGPATTSLVADTSVPILPFPHLYDLDTVSGWWATLILAIGWSFRLDDGKSKISEGPEIQCTCARCHHPGRVKSCTLWSTPTLKNILHATTLTLLHCHPKSLLNNCLFQQWGHCLHCLPNTDPAYGGSQTCREKRQAFRKADRYGRAHNVFLARASAWRTWKTNQHEYRTSMWAWRLQFFVSSRYSSASRWRWEGHCELFFTRSNKRLTEVQIKPV